jgi:hypothetical protein
MRHVLGILLVILSTLGAHSARADDAKTSSYVPESLPTPYVPEYTLKQHRFLTPTYIATPFVSTNVRFQQGFYLFEIPDYPVTRRRNFDVSAVGITERISAGIRFLDRFQVFGLLQGQVLAGSNARSVVLSGTTYNYSFGGGLAARLLRSEETGTQLSVRAQVTTGPLGQLDLLAFANDVIESDIMRLADIFSAGVLKSSLASGTETVFRAHAVAAQALGRYFGVQASFGLTGYWDSVTVHDSGEDNDKTTKVDSFKPSGGISIDAVLLPHVGLGFNLEYAAEAHRREFNDSEGALPTQLVHTLAAGIHLVDARFQAGITIGTTLGLDPIERTSLLGKGLTSGTPTTAYGQLALQYLW